MANFLIVFAIPIHGRYNARNSYLGNSLFMTRILHIDMDAFFASIEQKKTS